MTHQLRHDACRSLGILALASILVGTAAVRAAADDEPGPADLARIAEALKGAGYQSFEGVEFDDGAWQVDDAVGGDGREYVSSSTCGPWRSSAARLTEVTSRP